MVDCPMESFRRYDDGESLERKKIIYTLIIDIPRNMASKILNK